MVYAGNCACLNKFRVFFREIASQISQSAFSQKNTLDVFPFQSLDLNALQLTAFSEVGFLNIDHTM